MKSQPAIHQPTTNMLPFADSSVSPPKDIRLLEPHLQIVFGDCRENEGWMDLASVGNALRKLIPDFHHKDYGFEKLAQLLQAGGSVEIRKDESRFPPTVFGKLIQTGPVPNNAAASSLPTEVHHPEKIPTQYPASVQPPVNRRKVEPRARFNSRQFTSLYSFSFIPHAQFLNLRRLALKESWEFGTTPDESCSSPILKNYLRWTFFRLQIEDKVLYGGDLSAFNTGLVDRRYEPIYALFQKNKRLDDKPWHLCGFCIAGEDYLGKELVRAFNPLPSPPHYFTEPSSMFYDLNADTPSVDWRHVIIENLQRLPIEFLEDHCPKGFSMEAVIGKNEAEVTDYFERFGTALEDDSRTYRKAKNRIEDAVDLALKRVRWNYKTAIPVYFPTLNQMNMLLPLALVSDEITDIALVVEKAASGNYLGHTILPLDWAYNNARLVCRPNSDWLSPDLIKQTGVDAVVSDNNSQLVDLNLTEGMIAPLIGDTTEEFAPEGKNGMPQGASAF